MSFDTLVKAVVTAACKGEKSATGAAISVGRACHRAILSHLESVRDPATRRVRRAEALRIIREQLAAAGYPTGSLTRSIQVCHVADTYGLPEARGLPLRVVAAFGCTLQRIAKEEEWKLRPKTADACRELWGQVVAGEVEPQDLAAAVRVALDKNSPAARDKPTPLAKVQKLLPQLSEEHRRALWQALSKQFGGSAIETPAETIVMDTRPGKVAEVKAPGIAGRLLGSRKAG